MVTQTFQQAGRCDGNVRRIEVIESIVKQDDLPLRTVALRLAAVKPIFESDAGELRQRPPTINAGEFLHQPPRPPLLVQPVDEAGHAGTGAIQMVDKLFHTDGAAQDEFAFKFANDVQADQTTEIDRMQQMLDALPNKK